jgi:thiol-disulfide isomerase/thioredoxin
MQTPAASPVAQALPAVTLECFTGGQPLALDRLGQPAVINLWASWCLPCRKELPALQAFADEMGDRVLVLGVVTDDRWEAAAAAGEDFGARYPQVFDPGKSLQTGLGRGVLPITIFVSADGSVRHTDTSGALTLERLRELASQHLELRP